MATKQQAREALKDQGITNPGPMLIAHVLDALARVEEETPAGVRRHGFDPGEMLTDTPELLDRTDGPLTDPNTELSYVIADVINKALRYTLNDVDDS